MDTLTVSLSETTCIQEWLPKEKELLSAEKRNGTTTTFQGAKTAQSGKQDGQRGKIVNLTLSRCPSLSLEYQEPALWEKGW